MTLREIAALAAEIFGHDIEEVYTRLRGYRDRRLMIPDLSVGRGRTSDFDQEEAATALILYAASMADLGANSLRLVAGAVRGGRMSAGFDLANAIEGMRKELWVIRFTLRRNKDGFFHHAVLCPASYEPSEPVKAHNARTVYATTDIKLNRLLAPLVAK